tara:strand:+ start:6052 stop:6312 length:261 start_codon:yes stop_codon:yes gene_type:complete
MRGVFYDYTFTLPTKDLKETKKINMNELCSMVKNDLEQYYHIEDITINNQVLYNLQKRPHFCSKILKNRVSVRRFVEPKLSSKPLI